MQRRDTRAGAKRFHRRREISISTAGGLPHGARVYRLLLILSLLPLAAALGARWWFALRVLRGEGRRACRCDLGRWFAPGAADVIRRSEASAAEFGGELRDRALAVWKDENPKAAASREGARRFGMAVPPLSILVAVFAVLVGKLPVLGAIAIFLAACALAAVFGLMSLPAELSAISRAAKRARDARAFPDGDDEMAVIRCAQATAWDLAIPPVLRWVGK